MAVMGPDELLDGVQSGEHPHGNVSCLPDREPRQMLLSEAFYRNVRRRIE